LEKSILVGSEDFQSACPTIVFKVPLNINFASSNTTSPNMDDKFVKIENELAIVKNHMQKLFVYIASKEDVSEDLATIIVCLVHSSTNEV